MASRYYRKPYLDSGVFIGWIKGEKVKEKDVGGNEVVIDRGKIAESILALAESHVFPIIISALTIAEVHKKRGKEKLEADENQNVLDYFEHEFVNPVTVDRSIGEEANRLCRKHEDKKLSPADAIHLACAKRAGCDVLLSWDEGLNSISDPAIRIERPRLLEIPEGPLNEDSAPLNEQNYLFEVTEQPEETLPATLVPIDENVSEGEHGKTNEPPIATSFNEKTENLKKPSMQASNSQQSIHSSEDSNSEEPEQQSYRARGRK